MALFSTLFSWVMCDVIPCSLVLFLDQTDETSFHHITMLWRKLLPSIARCSSKCEKTFLTEVCALLSASAESRRHEQPGTPNFPPQPGSDGDYVNIYGHFCDWHVSILSEKIEFSFVSFSRGSQPTSNVCVPIFKRIYPSSDSACTKASIFTCTLTSYMNIWCECNVWREREDDWQLVCI
jgi:hypothetical protein